MGLPVFSWKKRGGREGGRGRKKIERERESFVCPSHNYISLPPPPSSLPPCLSLFFFFFYLCKWHVEPVEILKRSRVKGEGDFRFSSCPIFNATISNKSPLLPPEFHVEFTTPASPIFFRYSML